MVYVQDINGKPMMPTTRHGKVRRLLKDKNLYLQGVKPVVLIFEILMVKTKEILHTRN